MLGIAIIVGVEVPWPDAATSFSDRTTLDSCGSAGVDSGNGNGNGNGNSTDMCLKITCK